MNGVHLSPRRFRLLERSSVGCFNFKFSKMDYVSKVFIHEEGKLIHLDSYASFGEGCEDFVNMTDMLLDCVRVNDDVIDIGEAGIPSEFG